MQVVKTFPFLSRVMHSVARQEEKRFRDCASLWLTVENYVVDRLFWVAFVNT